MMTAPSSENRTEERTPRFGLSGKLLLLTILFVMLAEVLIYVPSIANFRLNWLADRVAVARSVAIVLNANSDPTEVPGQPEKFKLPDNVVQQVLDNLGAKTVAIKMGNQRKLLAVNDMPHQIHHDIDLRETSVHARGVVRAADAVLLFRHRRHARGRSGTAGHRFHRDRDRRRRRCARRCSRSRATSCCSRCSISAITATLVYLSLHYLFVRPMNRLTTNMVQLPRGSGKSVAHRRAVRPHATRSASPSTSSAMMQRDLASMLQQKSHLAALGLAVSKINHDLRNLLASAQLFSDRLVERARPERAALRAEADAVARARDRVLPVDALLRPGEGAAAGPQAGRARGAGGGRARDARAFAGIAGALDRGGRTRPACRCRPGPALPRHPQPDAQRAAGAGKPRAERARPRSAAHHRPARGRGGGDRSVRHRPGRRDSRRACTCSRRSRARRAAAAPGSGLRSRPSWCARMAARSASSTAPSARPSGSSSPTGRSISAHGAASGRALRPGARSDGLPLPLGALEGWGEGAQNSRRPKPFTEHLVHRPAGAAKSRGAHVGTEPPPSGRARRRAPVAQLDRALDYEFRGREFESLRARQIFFSCEKRGLVRALSLS